MEWLVVLTIAFIVVFPMWKVCTRAGFHGAMSLLVLIPFLGILILGSVLSFSKWPDRK